MREIKFRAWDGETLQPVHDSETYVKFSRGVMLAPGLVIEQYTGLRDKNGVEVYEGDIDKRLNEIIFDDGCFKVFVDGMGSSPLFVFKDGLEIIGNIHENLELLEADKTIPTS